jgi:hypothetical protein
LRKAAEGKKIFNGSKSPKQDSNRALHLRFGAADSSLDSMMKTAFLLAAWAFASPLKMFAADDAPTNTPPAATNAPAKEPAKEKSKEAEEKLVQSKHTVTIDGQTIHYTASTGTIFLRDEDDKPTASVFYIAYTRDDTKDLTVRPVTWDAGAAAHPPGRRRQRRSTSIQACGQRVFAPRRKRSRLH